MISYGIYNGESPFTRDASHNFSALSSWSVATQKSHFGRVLKPQKLKSGGGGVKTGTEYLSLLTVE